MEKIKILLAAFILLTSFAASADLYFVSETTSATVPKEDSASATELIKSFIEESHGNQITEDSKHAKFVLQPKLLRLGSAYIMSIDKFSNGKLVFSSQLKAASIEELDSVSARLTRAVMDEVPAKGDARIGDVTEAEASAGNKRKETQKHWYFGFGPYGSSGMGVTGVMYNLDIAYAWGLGNVDLKIFYDGTSTFNSNSSNAVYNSSYFSDFGLGANFFFNDTQSSPLVEADLGFGGVNSSSGFAVGAGVGWEFFRTSSVNLELLLRYAILLNQDPLGTPSVFGFRVGIYF